MPTLNWIGKKAVENHHRQVPFHLFRSCPWGTPAQAICLCDFICRMEDGRILVIEYKNSKDWDLPDNEEKRQLGELWERRSGGKGLFIMPRGKDWAVIRAKAGIF